MTRPRINGLEVVLTSASLIKVRALEETLIALGWSHAYVIPVKAASGVGEQPFGDETVEGARNRIASAKVIHPGADLYVSVENGLYPVEKQEALRYFDTAVVVTDRNGTQVVTFSDPVEFPATSVEEARRRGFATTTVGKVMQEAGIVHQHDDPHATLVGRSRKEFLVEALKQALRKVNQ